MRGVGYIEGKPFSVARIAAYMRVPRTTVIRSSTGCEVGVSSIAGGVVITCTKRRSILSSAREATKRSDVF